ncbi:MAG: CRTAC1 family protein [Planctomycetia bacterium]
MIAALAACSDAREDAGGASATSAAGAGARASDVPSPAPAARLPGRVRRRDAEHAAWMARLDPVADGWPLEGWAEIVEARLVADLSKKLDRRAGPVESGMFAATARAELAPVVRVRAAPPRVEARSGPGVPTPLPGWFEAVRAGAPAAAPRVELELTSMSAADGRRRAGGWLRAIWDPVGDAEQLVQLTIDFAISCAESRPFDDLDFAPARVEAVLGGAGTRFEDLVPRLFAPGVLAQVARGELELATTRDRLAGDTWLAMTGACVGDWNADGLEDLYVCRTGGLPNWLFLREASGGFREAAREAGVAFLDQSSGALAADMDGDGALDLVLGAGNGVFVCWNDGRARFAQATRLQDGPLGPEVYSIAAADPDKDGDLDLYATRYVAGGVNGGVPTPYHDARNGAPNLYWRNEGARRFVDGRAAAGFDKHNDRFSLSALWADWDDDGDPDLYVTNDFGRNNYWVNDGAGRFVDAADERSVADGCAADQAASMGASSADHDLDGDLDLHVTNMHSAAGLRSASDPRFMSATPGLRPDYMRHARGNTLLVNEGGGRFRDASVEARILRGGWGWGALHADLDGDGLPDIHAPAGFITNRRETDVQGLFWRGVVAASPADAKGPVDAYSAGWGFLREATSKEGGCSWNGRERDYSYLNLGDGTFAEVAGALGLDDEGDARGLLRLDLDDDGGQDLVLVSRTAPMLRVLRNPRSNPHALSLELVDRVLPGATVRVSTDARRLRGTVHAGEGYLSSSSPRLLFGLAPGEEVRSLEVQWSDGARESFAVASLPPPQSAGARRAVLRRGAGAAVAANRARASAPSKASAPLATSAMVRSPLCDPFPLPSSASRPGAAMQGLLVVEPGDAACEAALRALSGRPEFLTRSVVRGADARLDQAIDVLLMEVFGPFESVDLPLLLLARRDAVEIAYRGAIDAAQVAVDAALLQSLPEGRSAYGALAGGTAGLPSRRDLAQCAEVYDLLGLQDWSRRMREVLRARAGR